MVSHELQLPTSTPEAHGVPSAAILAFIDAAAARNIEFHSLMLLRHGHILAEGWWAPYEAHEPHMLFSLSKSFTSTAIGLAVSEGRLTVDDTVLSFFPDEAPADPGEQLAAMRVRHLLSMSTGHHDDTTIALRGAEDGDWAHAFLAQPVTHTPGTYFVYNSGATYMLSAIIQRVTGTTLLDYLRPRLLEPLGIADATWETCPRGINTGGWGLNITTADIARFGQLYLQEGVWEGRQLVPATWVAEATTAQIDNSNHPSGNPDWTQGYGYQFWRCRHNAYRGDGAFGQFCVVMPEQEAVFAATSGTMNLQGVLDLVWEQLLPALSDRALPDDEAASAALKERLAGLMLPMPQGAATSPTAAQVSGRTFTFAENEQGITSAVYDFAADRATITITDAQGQHTLVAGNGAWLADVANFGNSRGPAGTGPSSPRAAAAVGTWTDEQTFELRLRYTNTPFGFTLTSHFTPEGVAVNYRENVGFAATERPSLEGRLT
jgi:CubicO group peptidase (beta-lactamase class C family)